MGLVHWLRDHSIVFMLATFVGLLALTFWPGRRPRFERDALIPLQDDR